MNSLPIDALGEPTRPVNLGFQILLGSAIAGAMITLIPILTVIIPAQVSEIDPQGAASSLAIVLAVGAAGAFLGNPIAGALSDRTTAHLGRRRPWLLAGMLGSAFGLGLLAMSPTISLLAAGWFITQFFGNVLLVSYNAVMPDHIPVYQRGATQAINGVIFPIAVILIDIFFTRVNDLRLAYFPVIIIMLLLTTLFVILYREPQMPKGVLPPLKIKTFLASFWVSPRKYPRFGRAWLTWLLFWSAYSLGTGGFFFLYVQNITQYASLHPGAEVKDGIATIQILQIAVGVPLMLGAGVLSDRLRRRKMFVIAGMLLVGVGLALLAGFSSWPVVLLASVIIGAGFNLCYGLGLALITQLLPSASSRGKDLGVINIASTIPQILLPWLGAAVINSFGAASPLGYQALFITGLIAAGLATGLLRGIRE